MSLALEGSNGGTSRDCPPEGPWDSAALAAVTATNSCATTERKTAMPSTRLLWSFNKTYILLLPQFAAVWVSFVGIV